MPQEKPKTACSGAIPKPPDFLKTKRSRDVWRYLIRALDAAGRDYKPALPHLALLALKVDLWRDYVDQIESSSGIRYEHDRNGGSLEQAYSRAERKARTQLAKSLHKASLTVLSARRVKAMDIASSGDLFDADPFAMLGRASASQQLQPDEPPWKLTRYERRLWKGFLLPVAESSGLDFSTAGLALGVLAAAFSDLRACLEWLEENRCSGFVRSKEGGDYYEVSASSNRWQACNQIERMLERNGMTIESCAKYKLLNGSGVVAEELAELLNFINDRPD